MLQICQPCGLNNDHPPRFRLMARYSQVRVKAQWWRVFREETGGHARAEALAAADGGVRRAAPGAGALPSFLRKGETDIFMLALRRSPRPVRAPGLQGAGPTGRRAYRAEAAHGQAGFPDRASARQNRLGIFILGGAGSAGKLLWKCLWDGINHNMLWPGRTAATRQFHPWQGAKFKATPPGRGMIRPVVGGMEDRGGRRLARQTKTSGQSGSSVPPVKKA